MKQANGNARRCIDKAIEKYGLAQQDPKDYPHSAASLGRNSGAPAQDLRGRPFVTIDGSSARDFDDAVHCERDADGLYHLSVAVADVSSYVKQGSRLDQEASSRGTSVYFPDQCIPMLPRRLSEGECSLMPNTDRYALVCQMRIDRQGQVRKSKFFNAVIRSAARLEYEQANELIKRPQPGAIGDSLAKLKEIADILLERRSRAGAVCLDIPSVEPVFLDDEITGFEVVSRLESHILIEECMLAANVQAARFLTQAGYPLLYRVHPSPREEKSARLMKVLAQNGIKTGRISSSADVQKVAGMLENLEPLVKKVLTMNILRLFERAQYRTDNAGHYGLAEQEYTHFTSPIRRYPDLLVHRAIKAVLAGKRPGSDLHSRLTELGEHCTQMELAAERAAQQVVACHLCIVNADKIGSIECGVISGFSRGGCFVSLDSGLEGMARFSAMDDYYELDDLLVSAIGRRSRRELYVGMKVDVQIARLNTEEGKCEMKLCN